MSNELKLATLHELQTQYDVQDVFDLLEIIDAHATVTKYVRGTLSAKK